MLLPYDMFELTRSAEEAKRFDRMSNIYHRGQSLAWNGTEVLESLVRKYGGIHLPPELVGPLRNVFGSVLWGELAAWRIAAQLADRLEPLEAKMAATSQAHDEARHFYVMHDYLKLATGSVPPAPSKPTEKLLSAVLNTGNLAKKLVGMQLQVESTALTLFHATREARFCPVLADLLLYFEKDEARHVGLGTQYLPVLLRQMNKAELASFAAFQLRVIVWQLASVRAVEKDLLALGLTPRRLLTLGQSKQALIYDEIWRASPDSQSSIGESGGRVLDVISELLWPQPTTLPTLRGRMKGLIATWRDGSPVIPTHVAPPD